MAEESLVYGGEMRERFTRELEALARPRVRAVELFIFYGIVAVAVLSCVGLPVAILLLFNRIRGRLKVRGEMRNAIAFAKGATAVRAAPVIVNSALMEPGGSRPRPGLLLVTFDETMPQHEMAQLVVDLCARDGEGWTDEGRAFAAGLLEDVQFQLHRRRQVPVWMAGGREVYACDTILLPQFFPDGYVSDGPPWVACIADPGPRGRIVHMPWWTVAGVAAPGKAEAEALLAVARMMTKEARRG